MSASSRRQKQQYLAKKAKGSAKQTTNSEQESASDHQSESEALVGGPEGIENDRTQRKTRNE